MNFDSRLHEVIQLPLNNFNSITDTTVAEQNIISNIENGFSLSVNNGIPSPPTSNEAVVVGDCLGPANILYNKFYVLPNTVERDFITEDIQVEIVLYSTFFENKQLTNISVVNLEGLVIQAPTTPFTIPTFQQIVIPITILKDGPPFQASTITFTFDGIEYDLSITGRRVLPFLFEPDWSEDIEIEYIFNNVTFRSEEGVEQRRSLEDSNQSRKRIILSVWENKKDSQLLHNEIRRFSNAVVAVPIFPEPLKITSNPENTQQLNVDRDFSFYFNLRNQVNFVFIKNLDSPNTNEIKEITSLDPVAQTIDVNSLFVNSYLLGNSIVYPVVLCTLDPSTLNLKKEDLNQIRLAFSEF